MMEMDRAMTTNLWNYSSYNQPLYQRYDRQPHHHRSNHYQTPDAMAPIFKSSQPYFNYAAQPPSVAADSVPEAWKMVRGVADREQQWPAAVTGHVLGRASDAAAAMAAAAQRGWAPYPGIGA